MPVDVMKKNKNHQPQKMHAMFSHPSPAKKKHPKKQTNKNKKNDHLHLKPDRKESSQNLYIKSKVIQENKLHFQWKPRIVS